MYCVQKGYNFVCSYLDDLPYGTFVANRNDQMYGTVELYRGIYHNNKLLYIDYFLYEVWIYIII